MRVAFAVSDSMGVRSMATMIESSSVNIFIDPGVALGPRRYGLPPAPQEEEALSRYATEIERAMEKCDVAIISHYHYDHHTPIREMHEGKKLYVKHPTEKINRSQRERAAFFLEEIDDGAEVFFADGKSFDIGGVGVEFSPPVPHGPPGTRLGYVIMTYVEDNNARGGNGEIRRLIHTSDVEGFLDDREVEWITERDPEVVLADGPPTYFLGYRFSEKNLEISQKNTGRLLDETSATIVLDHHLLRDLRYREMFRDAYSTGRLVTFAEYLGKENNLLEAHRKELWEQVKKEKKGRR